MKARVSACVLGTVLLAATARAADLKQLVRNSDLVVFGQVIRILPGREETVAVNGEKIRFRLDIAILAVEEALKGDPDLRNNTVDIGFPAFPRKGGFAIRKDQRGVWFLTKSTRKHYEAKTPDRFLPPNQLAAARRALRAVVGLPAPAPGDRAARIAQACKTLASARTALDRSLAAHRLGQMGALDAVPHLIRALADKEPSVRLAADVALRKITAHRTQLDFRNATPAERTEGIRAWNDWWRRNKGRGRKDLLLAAVRASQQPQPDFLHAVEGLADFGDATLLPLFRRTLDAAVRAKDNILVIAAARYLGRIRDRASVRPLAGLLDDRLTWTGSSARAAAARAIGQIVGRDFASGADAVTRCATWWRTHQATFQ